MNSKENMASRFHKAKNGDEDAINAITKEYAPIIEKIILQVQHYNIQQRISFTSLFDIGVKALKESIKLNDEKSFEKFITWAIRQKMLIALSKEPL